MGEIDHPDLGRHPRDHSVADPDEFVVEPEIGKEDDRSAHRLTGTEERPERLLLLALPAGLLEELSVLLLPHFLAAFLDDRGQTSSFRRCWRSRESVVDSDNRANARASPPPRRVLAGGRS